MAGIVFTRLGSFAVAALAALPARATLPAGSIVSRDAPGIPVSRDTTSCPGYALSGLNETSNGLSAQLKLAGNPCNAFGRDIEDLTIEVTYDRSWRLHVKIYDTAKNQYQVPASLVTVQPSDGKTTADSSGLQFHYNEQPFEFWITRRGDDDSVTPLFDTRKASLPPTPIDQLRSDDSSTRFPAFNLIFEDQYLEITSALPKGANIYGLGEALPASGFRRDAGEKEGESGTIQPLFANGYAADIGELNQYGVQPTYLEHRLDKDGKGKTHGVFLLNSNAMDVMIFTPPGANNSFIQYRVIGGVLDFYILEGSAPKAAIEQYSELVGKPVWIPTWSLGFHLCRWGYNDVADWKSRVTKMREANIPLEVQWIDIDLYDKYWIFTNAPDRYPIDQVKAFIDELHANGQKMIPIIDPGVAISDGYYPHDSGVEKNVFVHMTNGSITHGRVWPGDTFFPDWFAPNTQDWWTDNMRRWREGGVEFDGIWIDMNEASNFCDGICGIDYNPNTTKRDEGDMSGRTKSGSVNFPPYGIHNRAGRLIAGSIDLFSLHAQGQLEYDVHNLYGIGHMSTTHNSLLEVLPGQRPFIIGRSTFAGSGRWGSHWLGDNHSTWWSMWSSIQGVLQFQMFGIPMVGADVCGHQRQSNEELCTRWMALGAWMPFYRNHHTKDANFQEPYLWESTAEASRKNIAARYSLLPFWSSLFAHASLDGTPPVRALWWEFPDDESLFAASEQFMVGDAIIVTPVLEPNVTTVKGVLPGNEESEVWFDFWTHERVGGKGNQTFEASLLDIPVHIRGGSVLVLHSKPAYTTTETAASPYTLLVTLNTKGEAFGDYYFDDGVSNPPGPSTVMTFTAKDKSIVTDPTGGFDIVQKLTIIEVLNVSPAPTKVVFNGQDVGADAFKYDEGKTSLIVTVDHDLNDKLELSWATAAVQNHTQACGSQSRRSL